ncbi:MAG: phosphate acyltransferase PlsX [Wenzhouxiangellaceae bacterium]
MSERSADRVLRPPGSDAASRSLPRAVTLAVDAMGADFEPAAMVDAIALAAAADADLRFMLFGRSALLDPTISRLDSSVRDRIDRYECEHYVAMEASPADALRRGRGVSMSAALEAVQSGSAQAMLSAGNTGALMALSRSRLGMLPGIERPALMTGFPVPEGQVWVLDLGANIGVDAERLCEFALLGSAAVRAILGRAPRVGLLNIGRESNKGPDVIREAARGCQQIDINFVGFIEGHDVFSGRADVVVCDGFAGNVLLKSAEGVIEMLLAEVEQSARQGIVRFPVRRLARRLRERFDPARHNGASLLGVDGIVMKSHAHASIEALTHALGVAALEVRRGMLPALQRQLWAGERPALGDG